MEAEKEPESEADTVTDPTSSADKNQNDSPRPESASEAAEGDDEREKALVIGDITQETDGARNDEEKETNNPGKDILNPSTSGADKLVDDVQPQESSETTENNITRSNEEVSSSSSAEVSTVNSSSTVVTPSSAGEHVKTPVAAFPGSKRGRKPKAVQDSSMLDENDLEHLRKPFKHGWKREIVYRNTVDPSSKRSACDVYYFPPSGKKLRSMVDIATYLDAQRNSPVNLTHFTFKRAPLFEPPDEIVRSAGARKGGPKETSGTPDLQKSKAKKQVGSKSEPLTKRKIASSSATSLSTTPRPFASSVNGNTSTLSVSTTTASQLYRNVYNSPVSRDASTSAQSFRMVQQIPMSAKSSHGWTMRITDPVSRSTQKRTRPRPRTPDWVPSSASDDSDDSTVQENNVEIIKESACSGPRDVENEDDVERVLGTPSKLIASILRPEPQKRPLSDVSDVDDPTGKRIRTLAISSAPLIPGIQIAPRPNLIGANIHPHQNLRILTSMPGAVPVVTSFCSTKCPGNLGEPKLQCAQCKSLFHPQCVGHNVLYGGKTLCKACLGMKSTRVVILPASSGSSQPVALQSLLPLSSASSSQPQILIPISSAAFTRGGGMMTAVAGLVTPSSSSASKSLFTTAMPSLSASLRQPISSVNSFNIPPPPPLASYSLLTPASSVPRAQGSTIPPPPQLQPANIPSIRKPPPLHRPGLVPAPSQPLIGAPQVVSLPQPPVLQPCPSLISSRPVISTLSLHSNGSSTNVTESNGIVNIANTKTLQHANMASTTVNSKTVTTTVTSQSSSVLKPDFGNKTKRPAQKPCTDDIDVSSDNEVECIPSDDETETCASVDLEETDDDLPVSFASASELSNTTSANSDKHTETQGTLRTVQAKLGNMLREKRQVDLPPSTSDVPAVRGEMQGGVKSSSQNPCSSNMQSNLPQTAITVSQNVYNELSKDLVPQSFAENGEMLAGQGQSTKTTSITQNVQILTLPLSIAAKINLRLPMALKINSAEFIIQPTCVVKTEDSLKFLLPCGTFKLPSDPSSKLSVAISNDLSLVSAKKLAEFTGTMDVPVKDPKVLRREFLHSFRILQSSFNVMVKIFGYLSLPDLLRVRRVCKTWHKLATQPCLWHYVDIKDVVVRDWDKAAKFFNKVGVKSLNLKSVVHHASTDYAMEIQMWEALKKFIPNIQGLEQLYFNYVPSAALNYITERMPHLIDISVEGFVDASSTSDGPGSSTAETEEAVTLAVEEITKGSLTLKEAADFYHVSEEDLIHLTQKNVKLTEEEEKDVLLCCLRLSRMGFTVSLSTFMSRCQEMFARRYSSKSNVPISDVYCRDLYYRNAPMFRNEIDFTLSDLLRVRLEVHYSSLRKLYKSLGPRNALTASQILIFDLTTFSLGKMTQYTGKSDSVTVVSAMSACATFLPLMLIWPTTMASSNPDVINRTSKHGLPTSSLVFQYIRSVLGLVQKRPVVILCNGNSALLSEQLVSTCISDSVYFYCVQSDIAKFVFPSYHGGFLHMLKRQVTSLALSKEDFMERVEALLTFKKQFILLSTRLSVSATGVFPLNPKAPSQFQDVNVHLSINRANNAWTAAHALPSMTHPSYGLETKLAKDSKTRDNSIKGIPKLDEEEEMEMDKEEEEMEEESTHLHSTVSPKTDSKGIDREQEDRGEFRRNHKTHKKAKEIKKSSQPSVQRNNSRYELSSAQSAAYKILRRVKKHFLSPKIKMRSPKINIAHVQSEDQNERTKSEKVIPLTDLVQEPEKVASTPVESSGQPHSKYSISEKNKEGKSVTRFDFVTSSEGQAEVTSEDEEIIDVRKQVEIYKQKQKEIEERKKIASVHLDEIIQDVITQSSIYYEEQYAGDASGKRDESENVEAEKRRAEKSTKNFKQNRKEYEENNAPAEKVDESPLVLTATGNNSSAKDDAVEHDAEDNDDDEVGSEGMETDKSSGEPISDHVQERISKKKKKKHYTNQSEMFEESFQMRKDVKKKRKRKKKSKSESEVEDSVEVEHQNADESSFRDRKPKKDRHRKKKKRKEKKKKKSGAKHDDSLTFSECSTSEALKPETASLQDDEKPSTSEIKEKSGEVESESGETRKLIQLRRVSLLDHDYTRKSMEDNPSQAAESGNVVGMEGSDVEDVEMTDNAAVAELVPQIDDLPSSEISDLKGDEMGAEGSEDMVEEVVTSDHKLDKEDEESKDSESDSDSSSSSSDGKNSSSSGSKSSSSSSSGSSDKDSSSSDSDDSSSNEEDNRKSSTSKNNNVRRRNEKEQHNAEDSDSSSSSESSKEDDDDDSGDSSSDSDTSKKGGSDEEEEEDEDDDSKCQMCMRASPPHSKDMIIDWVDCDGNCGRWFHVICILRSHSKANVKHYVCPSCRCKR